MGFKILYRRLKFKSCPAPKYKMCVLTCIKTGQDYSKQTKKLQFKPNYKEKSRKIINYNL